MKKLSWILILLILVACNKDHEIKTTEKKHLAPLRVEDTNTTGFILNGISYNLPLSYEDLEKNGILLVENTYYKPTLSKDEQLMVNFKSETTDFGGSFKNTSNAKIDTKDAIITEVYINSALNKDFEINGLKFGDTFQRASRLLAKYDMVAATNGSERTINYQTKDDDISLYFTEDKLVSVAIFAKEYMREKTYVDGEFIVFGQSISFPVSLREIEHLLGDSFDIDKDNEVLKARDKLDLKIHSPFVEDSSYSDMEFTIKNTSYMDRPIRDCDITRIVTDQSLDLSVGNIFLGANNDELSDIDKKNQNPSRLSFIKDVGDGVIKMSFQAENDTQYNFYTNGDSITRIEIINQRF